MRRYQRQKSAILFVLKGEYDDSIHVWPELGIPGETYPKYSLPLDVPQNFV